jgi:hypothetical protein
MSVARRRSLSSRIFRRVQAHAGVAALFRTRARPIQAVRQDEPAPEGLSKPIPAVLAPPDPQQLIGRVIGAAAAEFVQPVDFRYVSQPPAMIPIPPASAEPQAPVQRSEPPQVEIAPPEPEERKLDEDWPRLQNILQRHREAQPAETKPVPESVKKGEPPARIELEIEVETGQEIEEVQAKKADQPALKTPVDVKKGEKPEGTKRPRKISRAQKTKGKETPTLDVSEIKPPEPVTTETEEDKPNKVIPPEPVTKPSEKVEEEPAPRAEVPPTGEKQEPPSEQTRPAKGPPISKLPDESPIEPESRREETMAAKPTPSEKPVIQPEKPLMSAIDEEEEPEAQQVLPLEAAWPVVQREVAGQKPVQAFISPPEEHPQELQELQPVEKSRMQQVEGILHKVEADQPSDSRVEVITPRRPRPVTPARPVQMQPETVVKPLKEKVESEKPAKEKKYIPEPEQPMIETEIGPLPGDLWRLIGRPTPKPEPLPEIKSEVTAPPPVKPVKPEGYLWPIEEDEGDVEEKETVQMQADAGAAPAPEGAQESAGGEFNLDELARQVYREIKKRFSIEFERFRRKK